MKIPSSKTVWYISILLAQITFLVAVTLKYILFQVDFPLCWDPPGYVASANLILAKGAYAFMVEMKGLALYYQVLALFGVLAQNMKLTVIIVQTLVQVVLVYAFSKLTFKITNSYWVAVITAIVTPFTTNFVRLYSGPSQAFALLLICLVFARIDHICEKLDLKNLSTWLLILTFASVFWIHPHSFIFVLFILLVFFLIESSSRGNILKFGTLSFVISLIPQIPFIHSFISYSSIESASRTLVVEPNFGFYYSNLITWGGGNILLFVGVLLGLVALLEETKRKKRQNALIILSWSIVTFIVYHGAFLLHSLWPFWYIYASRSILVLPVPILLSLGIFKSYTSLKYWLLDLSGEKERLRYGEGKTRSCRRRLLPVLCISLVAVGSSLAIIPTFVATSEWIWRPWVSPGNYEQIVFARDELNMMEIDSPPIFLFYRMPNFSPGGINYMQNIIGMEIGEHYSYYGKLSHLLNGSETPSSDFTWKHDEENLRSYLLWTDMTSHGISDSVSQHPIIVISPSFYDESRVLPFLNAWYRGNGVYIIPPNEEVTIPQEIIVCHQDFSSATKGLYSLPANWSIAERTLNHYTPWGENGSFIEVDFPIYLQKGDYRIQVHLFDTNIGTMPVRFLLGDTLVHIIQYNNTMKPFWVEFRMVTNESGPQSLKVIIESGSPQYLKLDIIYVWLHNDH